MFSFINIPARIISILQLNITPRQVAWGVCLGLFLGFIPLNGPMALLLFVFFFVFKINRFSTIIVLPLFKMLYLLGAWKLADFLGGFLLVQAGYLTGFWRIVINLPILALLDLNNTLVAGGLGLSLLLFIPVYWLSRFIYISFIEPKLKNLQNTRLAKRLTKFKVVNKLVARMDYIRGKTE